MCFNLYKHCNYKNICFLHVDSKDSEQTGDQTEWLPRPIQVFAGHNALIIGAHIRTLVST